MKYGTKQKIGIASNPIGATVTVDGEFYGKTPILIPLSRRNNYKVKIDLPGYQTFETNITKEGRPSEPWPNWTIHSCPVLDFLVIFCLFISLPIDAVTGGLFELSPEQVVASLSEGQSNDTSPKGGNSSTTENDGTEATIRSKPLNPDEDEEVRWTANFNFLLGEKIFNENDWGSNEDHFEFGLSLDFRHLSWPLNLAIGYFTSDGPGNTNDGLSTSELNFGVRKIWDRTFYMRPFIGGGISHITVTQSTPGTNLFEYSKEHDAGVGGWMSGGIYWTFNHYNVGFEAGYSRAKTRISGLDVDAGGIHLKALGGYHW